MTRRLALAVLLILLGSPSWAATTVTIQPSQAFTRGVTIYTPRAIPTGATSVRIAIDRTAFTGDPVANTGDARVGLAWSTFLSLDGGTSWRPWGGAGATGGIVVIGGSTITESAFIIELPEPTNPNRQVAAVLAVTGNITLAITATVLP